MTTFLQVGLFSRLVFGEFIDWYAGATEAKVRSGLVLGTVAYRRLHLDNMGMWLRHEHPSYINVLKAALDRRRGEMK